MEYNSVFFVSLQASEYIFKYIIQSRRLFSLATGGQNEEEFRMCIHELFMSIRFFLSQENKGISPVAQTQVCVCESVLVRKSSVAQTLVKSPVPHQKPTCLPVLLHKSMLIQFWCEGGKLPVIEYHAV